MATAGTSRDVSSSFTSTKIAHFGPSGLFSDALPGCFEDELRPFSPTDGACPSPNAVPPKLLARCIRLRLLDPLLVSHGYVLDGYPASPLMLKDTFGVSPGEETAAHTVQIAAALAPSHIIVLSASSGQSPQSTPELKQWTTLEGLDWRFGGNDITRVGDAKTMLPSLEELFEDQVKPTVLPLAEFVAGSSNDDLNKQELHGTESCRHKTGRSHWFDNPASVHQIGENYAVSDSLVSPVPLDAWWKEVLADALEREPYGHHGMLRLGSTASVPSFSEGEQPPELAPAPAPTAYFPPENENLLDTDGPGQDYSKMAHRGQFDEISICEHDELLERSTHLRGFLMDNVMTHLCPSRAS